MQQGQKMLCCLALLTFAALPALGAEFRVPLMSQPPKLDGKVEPKEWATSVGFDGFAWQGQLERRRVRAFVGATGSHLYFAFLSQLPVEGELTSSVNVDTLKIVYDDSIEVWIDPTPGAESGRTFQMLANALGRLGFKMHARGNVREDAAWRGRWQVANGLHDGYWHCEIAVPIADVAPNRRADEGAWGINLCRNWKQPWQFSSLGGGAYAPEDLRFVFVRDATPAVAHEHRSDPATGDVNSVLVLTNPTPKPLNVRAEMRLTRDLMPEIKSDETLSLQPNERREVALRVKDESSRKFDLTLCVTSADGKTVFYDRVSKWQRGDKDWKWTTAKTIKLPVDVQFAYYPYLNRMRILADVTGLPQNAALDSLTAVIRRKGSTQSVKTVRFNRFVNGRQELTFDLLPLEGVYEIAVTASGKNVPAGELVKTFERTRYDWERNKLGRSAKVYPPFTPLRVDERKVSAVLRDCTMNDVGLWEQVVAKGKPLLAAPMRFRVVQANREIAVKAKPLRFVSKKENEVIADGSFQAGAIAAQVRSTWDYDGMMRVDLTLVGAKHLRGTRETGLPARANASPLQSLTLDVPLRNDTVLMLHAMGDGIRNTLYERVPAGEGVVWTSEKVQANDFPRNFCTYIYVGSPVRGLCWFAENDRGWGWDHSKPNVELMRSGNTLTLRVNLINQPTVIDKPRTITFGLQAAPVKPRLEPSPSPPAGERDGVSGWRHRYFRDNYSLLGTDINWFALGNCGAVYPAGKDMYFWEMLRRGNREQLSDADIEKVIEHGRKYFEPYGDYLQTYIAHVRYNLRARYRTKMIFYYNRASYQAADEFQTFKDEWCLTDTRTVGSGNGIGEIHLVPTESYIDHALYWYGKSFDVAGNQGVYWDNYFFEASYNTMMTGAYRREDGSIMPSTGIWGLRELVKRTFQYMNERGMVPITMAHMTSTNILPLLSFCTVQYDWEWKYSEGDVQHRYPREYILLVTNGEHAGTLPVLLHDHGKLADDPWTQRTFAGVSLVHELDPATATWKKSYKEVWEPLLKPIHALLDDKNLRVYRYWDDQPPPVISDNPDLPTIVYSVPGREAVFLITSYAERDVQANVVIDPKPLGFANGYRVVDVESGQEVAVQNNRFSFMLKKHDVREFRVVSVRAR